MGSDDANEGFGEGECLTHSWSPAELKFSLRGVAMVSECVFCGALAYERPAGEDPRRPKL